MRLCNIEDLTDGSAKGFAIAGLAYKVIVAKKNGKAVGYLDACPHYEGGTPMAWRKDAYMSDDGEFIACHSHGALFDMMTGECVLGPCLGRFLTPVPLEISETGAISADVSSLLEEKV